MKRLIPVLMIVLTSTATAQDPISMYPAQEGAPIKIWDYKVEYLNNSDQIRHIILFENTTDQTVRATKFVLKSINIFMELLDTRNVIHMPDLAPYESIQATWYVDVPGVDSFWMGYVFVKTVRFEGGEFWDADAVAIEDALKSMLGHRYEASILKDIEYPD